MRVYLTILLTLISITIGSAKLNHVSELQPLPESRYQTISVKSTVYTASSNETDNSPLITASGYKIDTNKLNSGKIRIIAVSQDLLKRNGGQFNFGDTVNIFSDSWRFNGKFIVQDCKNKRYTKSIDFLKPLHHFFSKGTHKFAKYKVPVNVELTIIKS